MISENLQVNKKPENIYDNQFNNYYSQYFNIIKKYIFKYLKDNEMSKDIAQNVFLKLYTNLDKLKEDNLLNWLYKVAHNDSIDYLKKKSTGTVSLEEHLIEPCTNNTPNKIVQQKEERKIINSILLKLPKNQRTAILLKDVKGYTYDEIARNMDISYGAVKSIIYRGRKNFIKYYKEVEDNEMQ